MPFYPPSPSPPLSEKQGATPTVRSLVRSYVLIFPCILPFRSFQIPDPSEGSEVEKTFVFPIVVLVKPSVVRQGGLPAG